MPKILDFHIEQLNKRLRDIYGLFSDTNDALFKIAWSEDEYEIRHGTYAKFDENGNYLGEREETRLAPKFKQWVPEQWVLMQCIGIPPGTDLTTKTSYELIWAFRHDPKDPTIPREPDWETVTFIISCLREGIQKTVSNFIAKYKEAEEELPTKEGIEYRVNKLINELSDASDDLTSRLHTGQATFIDSTKKMKVN